MQNTAYLVIYPINANHFAAIFKYATVSRTEYSLRAQSSANSLSHQSSANGLSYPKPFSPQFVPGLTRLWSVPAYFY